MSIPIAIILLIAGLALVIFFSEQLVKGLVGTALHFNVSAFLLSVIFIGFDPENLGIGAIGTYEGASGIAAGSILGSVMVAIALALGITALLAPVQFRTLPKSILMVPLLSTILFSLLILDKELGRLDGLILLAGYGLGVTYLVSLNKKGIQVEAGGEVAESLEEKKLPGKWFSVGLFGFSLVAIIGGSEMVIISSETLLASLNLSETFYGMTILAFLVSIEELARELPAALKGKPDLSLGNVIGSIMAFFLFNAGIIGLVNPLTIHSQVLTFFLPVALITVVFLSVLLVLSKKVTPWAGIVLLLLYGVFVVGGYGV